MFKELLKSLAGVLIQLPVMVITAFAQIFMMPFANGLKICFGFFISTLKGGRERKRNQNFLNRRVGEEVASSEEYREYAEINFKERMERLKFLFSKAACTKDEAVEYLNYELVNNPNSGLDQNQIENFIKFRFGEE